MELLHVATTNTVNGNARCSWILIKDGAILDGAQEDCSGKPERFRDYLAVRINVSPKEWRSWNEQLSAVLAWQAKVRNLAGV